MAKRRQSVSLQEEDAFKLVIDELMEEIVWHPSHEDIDVASWLLRVVDYNVPRGKQIRGRGVISAFKSFVGTPTKESLKPIYVLGWCVELFAAAFYIPEDIIRGSVTRRGQLCWHLVDDVGKAAANDAFLLLGAMMFIIDTHFKGQPCHKHIVQLFHKCFFNTSLGQNLDSRVGKTEGLHEFTMNNHYKVSKYKVGYFSFFLPMSIGKIMADKGDLNEKEMKLIEEVSLEMGHLYQVQDDYLDCFGNPEVTGKYGATIQGNRCSWFIIRALQKADYMQEKVLKDNYGKPGSERVHRVIKIFRDLDLVEEYRKYEIGCYKEILSKISKLPETVPALFFSETLDLILKRQK